MPSDQERLGATVTRASRLRLGGLVAVGAKPVARMVGRDPNCADCAERERKLDDVGEKIVQTGERAVAAVSTAVGTVITKVTTSIASVPQRISMRRR